MQIYEFQKVQIKLYGNTELGYYYLQAYVGQPPQLKNLIFDTGSKIIVFMCKGCQKCSKDHQTKPFNYDISKTFHKLKNDQLYFDWQCKSKHCEFTQQYSEGSLYKGFYAMDSFKFESELKSNNKKYQIFGCGMIETQEFLTQKVDGIIGFGLNLEDNKSNDLPPGILKFQQEENQPIEFSFCLSQEGGYVSLKGWNEKLHLNKHIIEIKNQNKKKWSDQYNMTLLKIKVDDDIINYDLQPIKHNLMQNTFLDTGTTYVYFIHQLFLEFQNTFDKFCQKNKKNCSGFYKYQPCYTESTKKFEYDTFPVLKFYFNKEEIEILWRPQEYIDYSKSSNQYCISIKPLERNVLGATFMKNYDIKINSQKNIIQFVRSDCSKKIQLIKYYDHLKKKIR